MRFLSVLLLLALTANNGVESKTVKKSKTVKTTTRKSDKATKAPSVKATKAPSVKASKPPSVKCSKSSKSSKSCKSEASSQLPSETPSVSMSPSLSVAPSDIPSDVPSASPSDSVSPSVIPSDSPSSVPSDIPSDAPSVNPSVSLEPSDILSDMPSAIPSVSIPGFFLDSVSAEPLYNPTKSGKSSKSKKSNKGSKTPTVSKSAKGPKSYKSAKQVVIKFKESEQSLLGKTAWRYNGKYLHIEENYLTILTVVDSTVLGFRGIGDNPTKWEFTDYDDDCQILHKYIKSTKSSSGTKFVVCELDTVDSGIELLKWDGDQSIPDRCCLNTAAVE